MKKDEKTKQINLFLNDDNERRVFGDEKPDPNKHYLILQNDVLHAKINQLEHDFLCVTKDLESKEEEVDKMEEQSRYMKGEMKNFVELRKMAGKITDMTIKKQKCVQLRYEDEHRFFVKLLIFIITNKCLLFVSSGVMWYLDQFSISTLFISELANILTASFVTQILPGYKERLTKLEKYKTEERSFDLEIEKISKEIKETDESIDFISKYIDSL